MKLTTCDKSSSEVVHRRKMHSFTKCKKTYPYWYESVIRRTIWTTHHSSILRHGTNSFYSGSLWLLTVIVILMESSVDAVPARIDLHFSRADTRLKTATIDNVQVDAYLERFGYYQGKNKFALQQDPSEAPQFAEVSNQDGFSNNHGYLHSEEERADAIRLLQTFFRLKPTGGMDQVTGAVLSAPRCGREDIRSSLDEYYVSASTSSVEERSRRKRYAVARYADGTVSAWRTDHLTWELVTPLQRSGQLSPQQQRQAIREAIGIWDRAMPISFTEHTGEGEADIRLAFLRGEHGPPEDPVFDGSEEMTNTLAHAWGPAFNPKGFAGDVHFDADDDWSSYSELVTVAVHELGHSMGLLHSKDENAIMYPVYKNGSQLGADDLAGINELYGPGWTTRTTPKVALETSTFKTAFLKPEWVTRPIALPVSSCSRVAVKSVFQDPSRDWNSMYLAVSRNMVHTLSPEGHVIKSQPIEAVFPELPAEPRIALPVMQERTTYFLNGQSMWAYKDGTLLRGYPRSVRELNFPETPRFSMVFKDSTGLAYTLLFGRSYWWTFDPTGRAVRPSPISSFSRDLPHSVQFVAQWSDNRLYAVTDENYVVLDRDRRQAIEGKVQAGRPEWLSELCQNNDGYQVGVHIGVVLLSTVMIQLNIHFIKY